MLNPGKSNAMARRTIRRHIGDQAIRYEELL